MTLMRGYYVEAKQTTFLKLLNGTHQYIIPIYQRTYSWQIEQCEQLWKDVIKVAKDEKSTGHFVGSIVYIQKGIYQQSTVPQCLVIDGQQRLTTLTILLSALSDSLGQQKNDNDITKNKIEAYYLFNREEQGDMKYKLILTQNDKTTLINLLEGKELLPPVSERIAENYKFFKEKIEKAGLDVQMIYRGLSRLIVVDIALDREHDDPQRIFESMNSTGLALSQADLIRNYVLMDLEPSEQEAIYNEYWYPMEKSFGQTDNLAEFDRFMRDYLTLKTGSIPNIDAVYPVFKSYAPSKQANIVKEIVKDIYSKSKLFVKMALEKEVDLEIKAAIHDINELKVDVAYPFLLEAYDDLENNRLSKADFLKIIRVVESYVFRRSICGVPTNSMNKTFATLSKELDKTNYLESLMAALQIKDSYRRFPNDEEFMRLLVAKDVYNFRNKDYWLRKLENYNRKEPVNVEDYTIEHIMPQNENLSDEWKKELGDKWEEIHKSYLHTLGNLTLTGYNSELSDRPFIEKRNMEGGFADSPIRLNHDLADLGHWNEAEIKKRAETLAKLAVQVWTYPVVSHEIIAKYRKVEKSSEAKAYTLNDHQYLQGPTMELFEQLRKRILNMDSSVVEEILKLYIAYKTTTNFVDIVPQKSRLRLTLNMKFKEVHDPKDMCIDVTNKGRWGNGDVEVYFSSLEQIDDVMALVRQSYEKHVEDGED